MIIPNNVIYLFNLKTYRICWVDIPFPVLNSLDNPLWGYFNDAVYDTSNNIETQLRQKLIMMADRV